MGVKKFLSHPSLKIGTDDFCNFLHMSHKIAMAKNPESFEKICCRVRRYFAFYMLGEFPVPTVPNHKTESILLRSDCDTTSP